MQNQYVTEEHDDEMSVKEIILKIKRLITFLKFNFWKVFILSVFVGAIGFLYAFLSGPIYISKTKFLMKESSAGSSLMGSLGSLGTLIGGAAGTASPFDRTIAIMGSERIVGGALFSKIKVDGKVDLAINHLINVLNLHETWESDTLLNGVIFPLNVTVKDSLGFKERKAYRSIINLLISENQKVIEKSFDKKSGVFDLLVRTKNEDFSIQFNKRLYKELEKFMYEQSINSSSKNVLILNNKLDSIKSALNGVQNTLARTNDRTLGLLMQEDKVDQKKLIVKEQMLTLMYGEAQKNLETFKFLNESINPGLEVIETPFSPIQPTKKSIILFSVLGFLLANILGFSVLLINKWIREQS